MKKKHGASFSRPDKLACMIAGAHGHGRALPLAGARPARGGHGPSQMQAQWLARVTAAASDGRREGGGGAQTVGGNASPARGGAATNEGWRGRRDGRVGVHDEEEDGKE